MKNHGIIEVETEVLRETEKGLMVSSPISFNENDVPDKIWLPKSLTQVNSDGTISLPRWLAEEKELV